MDNSRIVTVCCSMSDKAKLPAAISPVKEATKAIHTLGLNFTLKLWAECLALMGVYYAWPLPEANSTSMLDLYCLWPACPCLSWSVMVHTCHVCVNLSLHSGLPSRWCCTLIVALYRCNSGLGMSHGTKLFSLHEIFKCAHFKFFGTWPQARMYISIHTLSQMQSR